MSVADVIVAVLVVLAVLVGVLSCIGVLLAATPTTASTTPRRRPWSARPCSRIAVVIEEGIGSQAGIKSIIVALLLVVLNTVLVHATARAAPHPREGALDARAGREGDAPRPMTVLQIVALALVASVLPP